MTERRSSERGCSVLVPSRSVLAERRIREARNRRGPGEVLTWTVLLVVVVVVVVEHVPVPVPVLGRPGRRGVAALVRASRLDGRTPARRAALSRRESGPPGGARASERERSAAGAASAQDATAAATTDGDGGENDEGKESEIRPARAL